MVQLESVASRTAAGQPLTPSPPPNGTRRVLVVEDDDVVRCTVSEAIALEGYEVRSAPDGATALSVLDTWRPDVILLDLMMPIMTGYAFLEEQRRRAAIRDIPVIVVSAIADLEEEETTAPAGTLAKPFDLEDLLEAIAAWTRSPAPA